MDLFGPTTYKSIGGNLYCLVIVDDFSRCTWVMFLGDKGETPEIFKIFARRAQREYNSPIVKIRSDNGTEFKNMKIEVFCYLHASTKWSGGKKEQDTHHPSKSNVG